MTCPTQTLSAGCLDVVINEIAWMGTENSSNDEWIVPQTLIYHSYLE